MTAICPVCGKEFTASVEGHAGRTKLCCSSVCKWQRINRIRHGQPVAETEYRAFCEKRKAARLAKLKRVCPVCGKEFVADPRNLGAKYCSIACANRARAGSKPAAPPAAKPTADQAYEASLARVRAYLKLPARARWANRGMLTDTELRMAEQMWENGHGGWNVHYNTIR
jgi:RNA polymerase subunit RPABC4/transcription elongation factor Spt4